MATKEHYISGICKWAKVYKPDEKYKRYTIDVGMSKEKYDDFKKIGLKNKAKEADGLYWVTLRRDPMGKIWKDGKQQLAGAPSVLDSSANPTTAPIGNGSEVTVVFSVYDYSNDHGTGKGSRLERIRIDNLVEYKKEDTGGINDAIPF